MKYETMFIVEFTYAMCLYNVCTHVIQFTNCILFDLNGNKKYHQLSFGVKVKQYYNFIY